MTAINGIYHCIELDSTIGRRSGIIVEKSPAGIHAIRLAIHIVGKPGEFVCDHGRQIKPGVAIWWAMLTYRFPKDFNELDGVKRFLGELSLRWANSSDVNL
jgi:hypothetical protein